MQPAIKINIPVRQILNKSEATKRRRTATGRRHNCLEKLDAGDFL
jgi:hypothetical protein